MTLRRRGRRLLAATYGATWLLCIAAVWLLLNSLEAPDTGSFGFRGFALLVALTFGTVGTLIEARIPGHRVGRLFLMVGLLAAVQALSSEYGVYGGLVRPGSLPYVSEVAWLVAWIWVPGVGSSLTFLPLLFPDGRLSSGRWKPVAVFAAVSIACASLTLAFTPGPIENAVFLDNPFAPSFLDRSTMRGLAVLGFLLLAISILLALAALVRRFQRSTGVARVQLKWFAFATGLAGLVLAGPGTTFNVFLTGDISLTQKAVQVLTIVSILGIPAAAGLAILRYHLYDIDLILKRSLVYSALTVLLGIMYTGSVVVLQAILSPFTSGETLAVAASTLAVAFLLRPVRDRIQGVVDRTFFRSRYDASRTLESFASEIRDDIDLELLPARIVDAVTVTMQPTHVGLWIRGSRPGG